MTLRAASGKPKSSVSGGSMVAKLKLKGIERIIDVTASHFVIYTAFRCHIHESKYDHLIHIRPL